MIPLNLHILGAAEARAAAQVVRSGRLEGGVQVATFEKEFAARSQADHACAVANGSTALYFALVAVSVASGDEVILPDGAAAARDAVLSCGAVPVHVALDPTSDNIDPEAAAAAVTAKTRAVVCSHVHGMPCDLSRVLAIARPAGLAVVEDASAALGSQILVDGRWDRIGRPHGDVACFALRSDSVITASGGGMIVTSCGTLNQALRRLISREGLRPVDPTWTGRFDGPVKRFASDDWPSEFQAAVGREQLRRLDSIVSARRVLAARYRVFLHGSAVTLPDEPEWARSNWQRYCVTLPSDVSRDVVISAMADSGVVAREASDPDLALRMKLREPGRLQYGPSGRRLLVPLYPTMTERVQRRVATALLRAIETAWKR